MYLEKFSLLNKSVIVTGATRGIGQAIAVALAEAGADVLGVGRSDHTETRNQVEAYGRRYVPMQLDIADEDAPEKIVHKAVESFGKVDILVNAAGITRRYLALEISKQDWNDVIQTNLTALFFLSQKVARQFIRQGTGGNIINIASMLSYQGGFRVIPYTASKAAVRMITMQMCNEWAEYGIRVNGIAPGYIVTDLTEAMRSEPDRVEQVNMRIPMKRWGRPEDIAATAIFLASDAAEYVNGFTIAVDGGYLAKG